MIVSLRKDDLKPCAISFQVQCLDLVLKTGVLFLQLLYVIVYLAKFSKTV